jgi:excisionase family DNA binding protein
MPAISTPSDTQCLVLTVEQAAARIGVKRSTMYKLIRSGEVESFTIGRLRRIKPSACEAYIERQSAAHGRGRAA